MRIFIFFIIVYPLISGCKKDNNNAICRADGIQFFSNGTLSEKTTYEYNDQGKIKKITTIYGTRTYDYFPDSIVISEGNGRTVHYLGSNGLVISSKEKAIIPDPNQLHMDNTYTYDMEGYLIGNRFIFSQLYNGNIIRDTVYTNYTVSNGNIIKVTSTNSYEEHFEYSTSILRENVAALNPFLSSQGSFFGKPPKNLIARITDSNGKDLQVYSYSFGLAGKVLEMTGIETGPPAGTTRTIFHYLCD